MPDDDDFDNQPTPEPELRAKPKPHRPSDSERARHRRAWASGVPVVRPEPADELTAPIELLLNGALDVDDRAQVEALRSAGDVYVLLMNLAKAFGRHREKERSGTRETEKQVLAAIAAQSTQLADLAARLDKIDDRVKAIDARVSPIEATIKSVKGSGWKAALAVIVALVGSASAIVATLQSKAERQGAADERSLNHGVRLDKLEAINADRLKQFDERPRAPRRDYDYDISPRPFVSPKKDQ